MPIRRHTLTDQSTAPLDPAVEPLTGLRPFVSHPMIEAFRAQDHVVEKSCRVVLSWGLRGDVAWRVPNTNPTDTATRTHPDRTTWYPVARARTPLTPGCFYRLRGVCVPSGMTQRPNSLRFVGDGAHGVVRVTVTWRDAAGSTLSTTMHTVDLPVSTLTHGAEDTTAGGLWRTMRHFEIPLIAPTDVDDTSALATYCAGLTPEILVEIQGSPRIVDAYIREVPYAFVGQTDPGASDPYAVQHLFADQIDAQVAPPKYSPAAWAARALVTAHAQASVLGPTLFHWNAYAESGNGVSSTSTTALRESDNDGTLFVSLDATGHTGIGPAAYFATRPGWSVSCGGYARRYIANNVFVLRDNIAVVPVEVRVLARTVTAGTSTVRVQTALHSYIDVPVAISGSMSWYRAVGYLEVGISPEQPVIAQVFLNHVGASGDLQIEHVSVHWRPTPAGS